MEALAGLPVKGLRTLEIGHGQIQIFIAYVAERGNEASGIDPNVPPTVLTDVAGSAPLLRSNGPLRTLKSFVGEASGINRAIRREPCRQPGPPRRPSYLQYAMDATRLALPAPRRGLLDQDPAQHRWIAGGARPALPWAHPVPETRGVIEQGLGQQAPHRRLVPVCSRDMARCAHRAATHERHAPRGGPGSGAGLRQAPRLRRRRTVGKPRRHRRGGLPGTERSAPTIARSRERVPLRLPSRRAYRGGRDRHDEAVVAS